MFGIACDMVMKSIVSSWAVPKTDVCTMRLRNLRLNYTHAHAFDTFGEEAFQRQTSQHRTEDEGMGGSEENSSIATSNEKETYLPIRKRHSQI